MAELYRRTPAVVRFLLLGILLLVVLMAGLLVWKFLRPGSIKDTMPVAEATATVVQQVPSKLDLPEVLSPSSCKQAHRSIIAFGHKFLQ